MPNVRVVTGNSLSKREYIHTYCTMLFRISSKYTDTHPGTEMDDSDQYLFRISVRFPWGNSNSIFIIILRINYSNLIFKNVLLHLLQVCSSIYMCGTSKHTKLDSVQTYTNIPKLLQTCSCLYICYSPTCAILLMLPVCLCAFVSEMNHVAHRRHDTQFDIVTSPRTYFSSLAPH